MMKRTTHEGNRVFLSALLACAACAALACTPDRFEDAEPASDADPTKARAELAAPAGVPMTGTASFEQVDNGVKVVLDLANAGAAGERAVHVHVDGDCSDIPGKSMGEHFDPEGNPHGLPGNGSHHIGDLGNVAIDASGRGRLEIVARDANLREQDALSFLDRALVVHEAGDKGTQPSGDAGKPAACGVIEATG